MAQASTVGDITYILIKVYVYFLDVLFFYCFFELLLYSIFLVYADEIQDLLLKTKSQKPRFIIFGMCLAYTDEIQDLLLNSKLINPQIKFIFS